MSQAELAKAAGLSERTVRALEQGRGALDSWNRALETLQVRVVGRNLPGGDTLGQRLQTLRKRQGLSRKTLAEKIRVAKHTIAALEKDRGRLTTLERVVTALGAGAYLAGYDDVQAYYTHAGNSSVDHSWTTPTEVLEALYQVFPRFDLDPCAPRKKRPVVRARVNYTAGDDGLSLPWHGVVFVNPPYGPELPKWVKKARDEVASGRAKTVLALIPARTETRYWHDYVAGKATVYFFRGRLRFGNAKQSAPFPSALVLWGRTDDTIAKLDAAFPQAWRVTT